MSRRFDKISCFWFCILFNQFVVGYCLVSSCSWSYFSSFRSWFELQMYVIWEMISRNFIIMNLYFAVCESLALGGCVDLVVFTHSCSLFHICWFGNQSVFSILASDSHGRHKTSGLRSYIAYCLGSLSITWGTLRGTLILAFQIINYISGKLIRRRNKLCSREGKGFGWNLWVHF